ncbi:MAG: DUF371 domain-containing protein [Nitrosopumilus sp. H13]|nr:MAG: DUF371 domain-containing protein [Nitrosopumilus sp. H13]
MEFEIEFSGHPNVRSNHQKTIEITKSDHLTPSGDCIVGVCAALGCAGLPEDIKARLRVPGSHVRCTITVGGYEFVVRGEGHPDLLLEDAEDIVMRKSDYVCPRTLAIRCDKASDMMPREMVALLRDPRMRGRLAIAVD